MKFNIEKFEISFDTLETFHFRKEAVELLTTKFKEMYPNLSTYDHENFRMLLAHLVGVHVDFLTIKREKVYLTVTYDMSDYEVRFFVTRAVSRNDFLNLKEHENRNLDLSNGQQLLKSPLYAILEKLPTVVYSIIEQYSGSNNPETCRIVEKFYMPLHKKIEY